MKPQSFSLDDLSRDSEEPSAYSDAKKYLTPFIVVAEVLFLAAWFILGFAVYQLFWTNIKASHEQTNEVNALRESWSHAGAQDVSISVEEGGSLGILTAPAMDGNEYPIFLGTDQGTLAKGPGVYISSQDAGSFGNFAIAAHRDGWNAPFSEIDKLKTCDTITIENNTAIYTYSVVSSSSDAATRERENSECMSTSTARELNNKDYADVKGADTVDPSQGSVVWSVPNVTNDKDKANLALITLTSCHPHWSNQQRYIVHGVLTDVQERNGDE